jgi:hypothetical protein
VNHTVELTEEDKALAKIKPWKPLTKVEARKTISENIELSEEDIQQAKQQTIAKRSSG